MRLSLDSKRALVEVHESVQLGEVVYLGDDNKVRAFKKEYYRCEKCKKFAGRNTVFSNCCGRFVLKPIPRMAIGVFVGNVTNGKGWVEINV